MVVKVLRVVFVVLGLPLFLLARLMELGTMAIDRLLGKLDEYLDTLEGKVL